MKTRRFFATLIILLAVISLLPLGALPATAADVHKISQVGLTLRGPVAGETVNLDKSAVEVDHPMEYKVVGVNWYKGTSPDHMGIDSTVENYYIGGYSYTVRVDLEVKGTATEWNCTYVGTSTDYSGISATVNGKAATVTHREFNPDAKTISVLYTYEHIADGVVAPMAKVPVPVAGEPQPSGSLVQSADQRTANASTPNWYVKDPYAEGGWRWMNFSDTYEAGKEYKVVFELQTKDGFRFSTKEVYVGAEGEKYVYGYVNGRKILMKMERYGNADDGYTYFDTNLTVEYEFGVCPAQEIGSVSFDGIVAPSAGNHPSYIAPTMGSSLYTLVTNDAVTGGAEYGFVGGICWSTSAGTLNGSSVFEQGESYVLTFMIQADSTHTFVDWPEAFANVGYVTVTGLPDGLAVIQVEFAPCGGGEIFDVSVGGLTEPVRGNVPDTDVILGQGYELEGDLKWFELTEQGQREMAPTDRFEYGKQYKLVLVLKADDVFAFSAYDQLNVSLGGSSPDSLEQYGSAAVSDYVTVTKVYDCAKTELGYLNVSTKLPEDGYAPSEQIRVYENGTKVADFAFTDDEMGNVLGQTDTFVGGRIYRIVAELEAQEGYRFSEKTVIVINGQTAEVLSLSEDRIVFAAAMMAEESPLYIISFSANGGAGYMQDIAIKGGVFELPECEYVGGDGKHFLAWSTDGTLAGVVSQSITVTGGLTLYALWESPDADHVHVYGDYNYFDQDEHYKLCVSPNCPELGSFNTKSSEPGGQGRHQFGNSTDCDSVCNDCGYVREAPHMYEHVCSEVCPNCGQKRTTEHTPGTAATCTESQTCTVCSQILVTAPGHTSSGEADCGHDQLCTVCQTVLTPASGAHTPGAAATCTDSQTCTVCGEELAAAPGHVAGVDWICDETGHWHICAVCGGACDRADHSGDRACDVCDYSKGLGAGAIVAIVAGSAAVLGGGGFCLYWFVIRKKKLSV